MTENALDVHSVQMAKDASEYRAKASNIVSTAVDRAHAHAVVALTETLRQTRDGRRTLRKASRGRSYRAAEFDLTVMLADLVGPSVASLTGLLRDHRESAYRIAFSGWLGLFPENVALPEGTEPTQGRIAEMRGLVLHGMELRREIKAKVDQAKLDLLATIEQSSSKGDLDLGTDRLAAWKTRAEATIGRSVSVAISDAMIAIDSIAGVDAVRPEFRPKDQYTP